jgi:hypothetical protein
MTGLLGHTLSFRSVIRSLLIILAILGMLAYVLFQARFLLLGPQIALIDTPAPVQNNQIIHIKGKASNISKISLNGRQIFTDTSGYFDEALVLENGYTIATIEATDRYGRTTEVVKQFVYTPTSIIPK